MRYDDDERVASCQREIQRLRRVVHEYESILNNLYIVVINDTFVRDTQVFYPEQEDILNNLHSAEYDNRWADDSGKSLYLGYFVWEEDEEKLKAAVSKKYGYDKAVLTVIKIDMLTT